MAPAVLAAFVQAAGDTSGGGSQHGGTVVAQSFNGNVTGIAASRINVEGPGGSATLTGCAPGPAVGYLGTVIPAAAETDVLLCQGGSPTLPSPADVSIPSADCATRCGQLPAGNKTGVKFHDVDQNGVQGPGEPGLIGWTIHVFDTATMALVQSTVTVAANPGSIPPTPDGFYSFILLAGNYTVCEAQQAGWQQTAPLVVPPPAGETLALCAPFADGERAHAGAARLQLHDRGGLGLREQRLRQLPAREWHLSEVPEPGPDQYVHAQCGPAADPEDHRRRGDR